MMRIVSRLRRSLLPLLLTLSIAPLLMLFCLEDLCASPLLLWGYPALLILLCVILAAVPARRRMTTSLLCCALLCVLPLVLPALRARGMLLCLGSGALLFFGAPLAARAADEANPAFYTLCIGAQLAAQAFFRSFLLERGVASGPALIPVFQPGQEAYASASALYTLLFILHLTLLLLTLNRISLSNATLARHRLPAVMRRLNTLLTLAFAALALLIASLPAVVSGVRFLWRMLCSAAAAFGALIMRLLMQESGGGMGGGPGALPFPEALDAPSEPSLLAVILEQLATLITLAVILVGSALLIRLLVRLIIRLVRRLIDRLRLFAASANRDYEDEVTDTREEGMRQSASRIRRAKADYPDTPSGSIRRRYARLLRRHRTWSNSSTARENLPDSPAALYERARYSQHAPTPQDAARFSEETRKL